MIKLVELTADGYYVADYIVDTDTIYYTEVLVPKDDTVEGDEETPDETPDVVLHAITVLPAHWTAILCPDGMYKAQYAGSTVADTGEHAGGEWVDKNAPTESEIAAKALEAAQIAIASRRFEAETAGITVSGMSVYTDRTTQMKLTAASLRADRDATYTVDWKQSDNTFITLSAAQIIGVGDAVGDYVQACYTRESILLIALAKGTYTDAMLQEGWPA